MDTGPRTADRGPWLPARGPRATVRHAMEHGTRATARGPLELRRIGQQLLELGRIGQQLLELGLYPGRKAGKKRPACVRAGKRARAGVLCGRAAHIARDVVPE